MSESFDFHPRIVHAPKEDQDPLPGSLEDTETSQPGIFLDSLRLILDLRTPGFKGYQPRAPRPPGLGPSRPDTGSNGTMASSTLSAPPRLLSKGASSAEMIAWTTKVRAASKDLRTPGKTALQVLPFVSNILDRIETRVGNPSLLSTSLIGCESASREHARIMDSTSTHYAKGNGVLDPLHIQASRQGCGFSYVAAVLRHIANLDIALRRTARELAAHDIEAPLPVDPTPLVLSNRLLAVAYQRAVLLDADRVDIFPRGYDEALSAMAPYFTPLLTQEIQSMRGQILPADIGRASFDYGDAIAHIIYTSVQGSSRTRRAEMHLEILEKLRRTEPTFASLSAAIIEIQRVDAAHRILAVTTTFSSISSKSSVLPSITHNVQSTCAGLDTLQENALLPLLEHLCTVIGDLERTQKKPPVTQESKAAVKKGAKQDRPKKPKVWPPPGASAIPTSGVKTINGILACEHCHKPSSWDKSDKTWHTSANCRSAPAGSSQAHVALEVDASDVAYEFNEEQNAYSVSSCSHTPSDSVAHLSSHAPCTLPSSHEACPGSNNSAHSAAKDPLSQQSGGALPSIKRISRSTGQTLNRTQRLALGMDDDIEEDSPSDASPNNDPIDVRAAYRAGPRPYNKALQQSIPSMMDSGCGPAHVASQAQASGPQRTSRCTIVGVGGVLLKGNKTGSSHIYTIDADGFNSTIQLPGETLFPKDDVDINLVSHSTLLKHGWTIKLYNEGGTAVAPSGERFNLEKRGSSWYFPQRPSQSDEELEHKTTQRALIASSAHIDDVYKTVPKRNGKAPPSTQDQLQLNECLKPAHSSSGNMDSTNRGSSTATLPPSNMYACLSRDETATEETAQEQCEDAGDTPSPFKPKSVTFTRSPASNARTSANNNTRSTPQRTSPDTTPKPTSKVAPRDSSLCGSADESARSTTQTVNKEKKRTDYAKGFMNPTAAFQTLALLVRTLSAAFGAAADDDDDNDNDPDTDEDDDSASTSLSRELDKWDAIHLSYLHASSKRMRKIAKNMDPSDPNRPQLKTLAKWIYFRKCGACLQGKSKRPAQLNEHPRTGRNPLFKAGEYLHVDLTGDYATESLDGKAYVPTVDGTTTCMSVTDDYSNGITPFPLIKKTDDAFIKSLNDYEARSGVKIKKLRVDNELLTDATKEWALEKSIDLESSAPYTQQQNGFSEGSVRILKDGWRTIKIQSCISDQYITQGYLNVAQQHNRLPSDRDPLGQSRSPLQQFPTLPYSHRTMPVAPFGCRAFPHIGKRANVKNTNERASAGIYLCQDRYSAGHCVLSLDTNTIKVYGYVHFEAHRFPVRELLLAGEPPNQDFNPNAWRKYGTELPAGVDDRALGEFCSGKQLRLTLPSSVHPEYQGQWTVQASKLIEYKDAYALRCVYDGYLGNISDLSAADMKTVSQETVLWIDIPMSQLAPDKGAQVWNRDINARDILKSTFPTATLLADFAAMSTMSKGHYPRPNYASTQVNAVPNKPPTEQTDSVEPSPQKQSDPDRLTDEQALLDGEISDDTVGAQLEAAPAMERRPRLLILPTRVVGSVRSTRATWKGSKSSIIPDRQKRTKEASSTRPNTRSQKAMPAKVYPDKGIVLVASDDGRVGYEPRNLAEARKHSSWPLWEASMIKEKDGLFDRGTFQRCTKTEVPDGVKILGSQFVYKDKRITGAKSRIVVRGDQQWPKPDTADTFSATPSPTEVRTLISLAVQNNYALHSLDISQAFVQADELPDDANLFIYPPQGSNEPPGTIWKLKRPLYGLAVAPRAWSETFKRYLLDYGFTSVNNSDTLYAWTDSTKKHHMHLVFHVDDILLSFSDDQCAADFKRSLLKRFSGSDEGRIKRYLGIDFTRDANKLHMTQETYAREILARFGMTDCNPCAAPMEAGYTISKDDCPDTPDSARRLLYQEITGALQYLVQWTRPDLAFATNELAKVNSNPSEKHLAAAKRVLRYLKGCAHLGLTYTRDQEHANRLIAFADADFAACVDTRRSISSYVIMMNGSAISWKSRQQKSVATSTSQAEFVSASWAADEILWLRRTLLDLNAPQLQPTPLWEDNRACRMMSENPVHKERSKHIDYRVHALRERVNDGVVRLLDCPTVDMTADMGTKSLPAPAHCKHRDTAMGLLKPTTPALPLDLSKRGGGVPPAGPHPPSAGG